MTSAKIIPCLSLLALFAVCEYVFLQAPCLDVKLCSPRLSMEIVIGSHTIVKVSINSRLSVAGFSAGCIRPVIVLSFKAKRRPI